jgi:hypothetical protein
MPRILAAALVASFVTLSGVAHASPQPSDRAWWPNEDWGYLSSSYPLSGYQPWGYAPGIVTRPVSAIQPVPLYQTTCRHRRGSRSITCTTQPW